MPFKKGTKPWNKSLTKEDDFRIAKYGKKVSKALRGKKHSKETRRKMSESHKEQVPWIEGKHHSKEKLVNVIKKSFQTIPKTKSKKSRRAVKRHRDSSRAAHTIPRRNGKTKRIKKTRG